MDRLDSENKKPLTVACALKVLTLLCLLLAILTPLEYALFGKVTGALLALPVSIGIFGVVGRLLYGRVGTYVFAILGALLCLQILSGLVVTSAKLRPTPQHAVELDKTETR